MKFDSNLAWKQASSSIGANRDLLLALSGVFFVLPSLAFALFFPQPQPAAGQTEAQMMAVMQSYYLSAMPALLPMALVQAAGTLAMLTLFTDRSRPTVGEAIKQGFIAMPFYVAAQLLLGIGLGIAGGTAMALGAFSGVPALAALLVIAAVFFAIYVLIRTSLAAPIVAVERQRNPVSALSRSWQLTKGSTGRIGLFYLLLLVAFLVVTSVIMIATGLVSAALAGPEGGKIAEAVVSSMLGAVMALYFVAVWAAVHRQLAGPSADAVSAPFE